MVNRDTQSPHTQSIIQMQESLLRQFKDDLGTLSTLIIQWKVTCNTFVGWQEIIKHHQTSGLETKKEYIALQLKLVEPIVLALQTSMETQQKSLETL